MAELSGMGPSVSQTITDSGWSRRFSPTPGRSCATGMPSSSRSLRGPMPECSSSRGESTAPAHTTTSLRARTRISSPSLVRTWTPSARVPFSWSLYAQVSSMIVRLARSPMTGCRYATEADALVERLLVEALDARHAERGLRGVHEVTGDGVPVLLVDRDDVVLQAGVVGLHLHRAPALRTGLLPLVPVGRQRLERDERVV